MEPSVKARFPAVVGDGSWNKNMFSEEVKKCVKPLSVAIACVMCHVYHNEQYSW